MTSDDWTQISSRVISWLKTEGLEITEVEDPKANFHCVVNYPIKPKMALDVVILRKRTDQLMIAASSTVADVHIDRMRELSTETRNEFNLTFNIELLKRPTHFEAFYTEDILRKYYIHYPIWVDGLSKDSFMKGLHSVHDSILLGQWILQREYGR